jgi:hypothetical protein
VFQNTNHGPFTENGKRKERNFKLKHEAEKPVCIDRRFCSFLRHNDF